MVPMAAQERTEGSDSAELTAAGVGEANDSELRVAGGIGLKAMDGVIRHGYRDLHPQPPLALHEVR